MIRCLNTRLVRNICAALMLITGFIIAGHAMAQSTVEFDIPPQDLSSALIQFGDQSGRGVLASASVTDPIRTIGYTGQGDPEAVLEILLTGTGLAYRQDGDVFVVVIAGQQGGESGISAQRFSGIEEVIVTGQKREERIQDVPIAISAFSMDSLDQQKIEGGFDLLKAVPNVTFSKTNFTGYNFQIRGIGTQAISATTDPGVAVSFNNTTLIVNRLFEQEYLDIERVEVLRGPQGTLYGRNATAGVINVITAKPKMGVTEGEVKIEVGNYNSERFRGHVNWAFSDTVAARAAFAVTKRDGFGKNLAYYDGEIQDFASRYGRDPIERNIDNRDLWTGRFSIGWQPSDRFRGNVVYERFEEDDRRMRSTKQLCHHADGNVDLFDDNDNAISVRESIRLAADRYGRPHQSELRIRKHYLSQLSQGCLPGDLFDKGNVLSSDATAHGAFGVPNGNAMPFVRALRSQAALIGPGTNAGGQAWAPPAYPDCTRPGGTVGSDCVMDVMASPHGQSRNMRDIFSLINPHYKAMSEIAEISFDYELSEYMTLSFQSIWSENELYSTQDFLRFKTLPMFNDSRGVVTECIAAGPWTGSSGCPNYNIAHDFRPRRMATPGGILHHPQLGSSDRFLMQDVSQSSTSQFSQELRITSSFDEGINFSAGANFTRFDNTTDYFVFINSLRALALAATGVYTPVINVVPKPGGAPGEMEKIAAGSDSIISCGLHYVDSWWDEEIGREVGSCIYMQNESLQDVVNNPQGHDFFLSRNPFVLHSAGIFGEIYVSVADNIKLTAGLRFNWDRKTFTPVPSQTMLSDWRGRVEGPQFGGSSRGPLLSDNDTMYSVCHPDSPVRWDFGIVNQAPCALSGMTGKGYPALPNIVQEWRVPTGRIGVDWKPINVPDVFSDLLIYGFYTRGYKAGGANPPVQSAPSGFLLEAAQGASAPRIFDAEYVDAFEVGVKSKLFDGLVSFNASAFIYDYKDYQVSKILDRSAVNENFDARIWGAELETLIALGPDTLFNMNVGYLRTRVADGEQSLDLMDRTQGGNRIFRTSIPNPDYDPNWVPSAGTVYGLNAPDQEYIAFDRWVVVRPTVTQASSCVAPALLIYETINHVARAGSGTLSEDWLSIFCPAGALTVQPPYPDGYGNYTPSRDAPNGAAGFMADVGGNELPNAPRFTVSLGIQHTYWLPVDGWSATGRVDWYWQDKSFHRIYNTGYDRLRDWSNTNASLSFSNDISGVTIEVYAKNLFNETPVTGAFLNSDDTGLSTNVFTLDPRLIGLSFRKVF